MSLLTAPTAPLPVAKPQNPAASLHAIREGDPVGAAVLYSTYAPEIRAYLRRHSGLGDVEDAVFEVLVEAARSVRELGLESLEELSKTILHLSQQSLFSLRRMPAQKAESGCELVSGIVSCLDSREREILLRSVVLSEREDEISSKLNVPVLEIRRTHARARSLFRMSHQERVARSA